MTLKHYDFETGPQGTTATLANTGANQMTLNTGTAIFDAAGAFGGSAFGLKMSANGANNVTAQFQPLASNKVMAFAFGFMVDAIPSTNITLATLRNAAGTCLRFFIADTGQINIDGATQTGQDSTGVIISPNTKYRISVTCTAGTTATNGSVSVKVYNNNSEIPLSAGYTNTAYDVGTAVITTAQFVTSGNIVWLDDIRFNDGSTTELGAVPNTRTPASTVGGRSVLTNNGPWTNVGTAASIISALADVDDTTYVQSPEAPDGSALTVALDPLSAGTVVVKTRHRASLASPAITRVYSLVQHETTTIATRTVTLPSAWTDYSFTLTAGENSAITDRAALALRWTDTTG
jgi:hypothetical protein